MKEKQKRERWEKGGKFYFLDGFLVIIIAVVTNMRSSNIADKPLNSGIAWNALFFTVLGRGTG